MSRPPFLTASFTGSERAIVDAEKARLSCAFSASGAPAAPPGWPFRQFRDETGAALVIAAKEALTVEQAALLLEYARGRGELRLYARIPYAAAMVRLRADGRMKASLGQEIEGELAAANSEREAFVIYARNRMAAAWAAAIVG